MDCTTIEPVADGTPIDPVVEDTPIDPVADGTTIEPVVDGTTIEPVADGTPMDPLVDGIAIDETKDGAFDTVNAGPQVIDAVDEEDRGILEFDIAAIPAAATINSAALKPEVTAIPEPGTLGLLALSLAGLALWLRAGPRA